MQNHYSNFSKEKELSPSEEQPSISIVDAQNENDPVAELIRAHLEEELLDTSNSETSSDSDNTNGAKSSSSLPNSSVEKQEENGESYYYVNVMEAIVRKKAEEYMNTLGMCTCNRCFVDTIAVALTNLPAKYVVVQDNSTSPLLNYYSDKLEGEVTIEVMKACMLVKEHPHHK
ncbi:MAG: late competence development ComFB family protein [Clostridiales bacterium]|nr:late competence development ComFB family protein [Clostridiales bacterium]